MAVSPEAQAFWAAAGDGLLVVERCATCGRSAAPPRGVCRACGSTDVQAVPVEGGGRLWSWTVNHQRWFPELEVPYVVGLVELTEHPGVRLLGRLRECRPDDLAVDLAVDIGFEAGIDGQPMLAFRPAAG